MSTKQSMPHNLRQEQAAETRQKLLESAKTLFAEKGYNGTSVRSINKSLHMADGIIYHYFPGGKQEILSVLIKESLVKMMKELDESRDDIEMLPLDEALNRMYILGVEMFTADLELIKILSRESSIMDLKETIQISNLFQKRQKWFAEFLSRRYEKGEIKKIDFEIAAKQFMSIAIVDIVSKLMKIDFIGNILDEAYLKRIIKYTLDLWKNP